MMRIMIKLLSGHLGISESCMLARSSSVSFWGKTEDPCEYPYFEGVVTSSPQWGNGKLGVGVGATVDGWSPLCRESLREDEDMVSGCVNSFSLWPLGFCVALSLLLDESSATESWKWRWWGWEDAGKDPFVVWVEWRGCVMSLCSRSFLLMNSRGSEMLSWFWRFSDVLWQHT